MSERNRDKIKRLEHELGRYEKKVGDLMKVNAQLREEVEGLNQTRAMFDAWIIQVALTYGEDGVDQETGEKIPRMKVLHLSRPKVEPTLRKYQLDRWVDKKADMIHIAVGLRNDPDDDKREAEAADGLDKC